ncbi:hypothetical protein [Luteolibacter sp. LG18]|uniref:hypothetical protein n=1 Tax=Luteolibacter sp. LG18 TaxID=2819286 RepID=UPI002B2F81B3|nr:hypothetical protein llg_17240 [Luteolibacter sp. LG18]
MPFPRNKATRKNYKDTQYLWYMGHKEGKTELQIEMTASVNGQTLIAELPRIVNQTMIEAAIDYGRKAGWTPDQAAPPFRCKYLRGQFTRLED